MSSLYEISQRPSQEALVLLQDFVIGLANNSSSTTKSGSSANDGEDTSKYGINARFSGKRTALHYFSQKSDFPAIIDFLVSHGADVDAKDWNGYTPLHCAASKGHKGNINALLSCGAELDGKNAAGETPLHTAIFCGHDEVALLLIGQGAPISDEMDGKEEEDYSVTISQSHSRGGCTMKPVGNNEMSVDDPQQRFAKSSNCRNRMGFTPLCMAQMCGRRQLAAFIKASLTSGAVANTKASFFTLRSGERRCNTDEGQAKPTGASQQQETKGEKDDGLMCVSVYDEERDLCDGATRLQRAALEGDLAEVEAMLLSSFSSSSSPSSAVDEEASEGSHALPRPTPIRVRYLRNVNARNIHGRSAIHAAAFAGHAAIVAVLVNAGGHIEAKDSAGNTPLELAFKEGHDQVSALLVRLGAEVRSREDNRHHKNNNNRKGPYGGRYGGGGANLGLGTADERKGLLVRFPTPLTALHYSASRGLTETVVALIERIESNEVPGGNDEKEAKEHVTGSASAASSTPLATNGHCPLRGARPRGGIVDQTDRDRWTALHYAAANGHLKTVEALVSLGANVSARDFRGRTPQECAKAQGQHEAIVASLAQKSSELRR